MSTVSLGTQFGVSNVIIPRNGPRCIPALLDFSATPTIEISGELAVAQKHIEYVQGVFIDNADNIDPFILTCGMTGQRIVAKARSQGYYALLMPNPPALVASTPQMVGRKIQLFFYNVPIQSQVWLTA